MKTTTNNKLHELVRIEAANLVFGYAHFHRNKILALVKSRGRL